MVLTELNAKRNSSEQEYQRSLSELKTIEEEYRLNERLREAQAQHIECINKLNFLKREIESSEEQVAANLDGVARANEDIQTTMVTIQDSEQKLKEFEENKANLQSEIDAFDGQTTELNSKLAEKKSEEEQDEVKAREARSNHESAVEAVHQISLKINEFDTQAKGLVERAQEEFSLDISQQTRESMNIPADFDTGAARERVNYLKGRVESFGPVNLVALLRVQ